MTDRFRSASLPGHVGVEMDTQARKVLRNTWNLLAMTLLFSAMMGYIALRNGWPYPGILLTLGGYFGLLFLTVALRNSAWGLLSVFALTGFMGATFGPIVNHYLGAFSNGHELVIAAFGATAVAFVGLSAFAMSTRRDFSFLGPFLFVGILVAFLAGLAAIFLQMSALGLAVSVMFAVLMCGLILYQTQQIVRGGERNYIMATISLYVSIYNLFISLLQIFGIMSSDD